jgi:hypothetical protein
MTWWQRLWHRRKMEGQLEKELRFHLDQHASELIAHGHDPQEARRQARLALGGPEQVKEQAEGAAERPGPMRIMKIAFDPAEEPVFPQQKTELYKPITNNK